MKNLYERLFDLLDRPLDDPKWLELLAELGEPSSTYDVGNETASSWTKRFDFYDYGFNVMYDLNQKIFASISFSFTTKAVKSGMVQSFKGLLHAGIKSTDTRDEVELRMGERPYYSTDPDLRRKLGSTNASDDSRSHWEKYELPPYHFTFIFDSIDEGISLLGIDLCKVRVYGAKNRLPKTESGA